MAKLRLICLLTLALVSPAMVRADQGDAQTAPAVPIGTPQANEIAIKLATYQRLLLPGGGSFEEINDFITQNLDWPQQRVLAQRREEALAGVTDPTELLNACRSIHPQQAATLARCAMAESGDPKLAAEDASAAWARGYDNPSEAASFLAQFGTMITPYAEWQRYTRQLGESTYLAERQLSRLTPEQRELATVLLAFRKQDSGASDMAAALPLADQADPAIFLAWSADLQRNGYDKQAFALWQRLGASAQATDPNRLNQFWNARSSLARQLLIDSDPTDAYALVAANGQTAPDKVVDAEFLAGFIALRKLNQPALAIPHFSRLVAVSPAVITLGRAYYWLGRAYAAEGNATAARTEYLAAARFPYVYYGQLAAKALGETDEELATAISDSHDPTVDTIRANALAATEMARCAQILVDQGNLVLARLFLQRLASTALDPASKVAAAYLANTLGLPDQALLIARAAGAQGVLLPDLGWPMPVTPPAIPDFDPALTLAITRQESNFDADAVSSAGALGLMQLMPETARTVARQQDMRHVTNDALTEDPTLNLLIGSLYLQGLMDQFNNVVPFAVAAYNAGPDRVDEWKTEYGDPSQSGGPDMIDWIEQIPFNETRNYVQRVIENLVIYRARERRPQAHPLAQWISEK